MDFHEQIMGYATNIASSDDIRKILPQVEYHLGRMEQEDESQADDLDELWNNFIDAAIHSASAHDAIPSLDAKAAEAGLRDNFSHVALGVVKSFPTDTEHPVIAWAAFNKHTYQGWKDEVSIVRTLALAGFDPNLPDDDSQTPLHMTAFMEPPPHSSPRAVRVLLKMGADANARNGNGDSPLTYLVAADDLTEQMQETAIMLLDAGADPFAKSDDGTTAYGLLKKYQTAKPEGRREVLLDMIEEAAGIVPPFGEKRQDGIIASFVQEVENTDKEAGSAFKASLGDESIRKTIRESMRVISKIIMAGMDIEDTEEFLIEAAPLTVMVASKGEFHTLLMRFCFHWATDQFQDEGTSVGKEEFVERLKIVREAVEKAGKKLND